MSGLNRHDNYMGRVNYAAQVISAGRATSRAFDNCFENYDGDAVAAALVKRSQNNPRLASNLFRYINRETAMEAFQKYAGQNLTAVAQGLRDAARARHGS